jgi:hypothetical protein
MHAGLWTILFLAAATTVSAQKFYPDDPLEQEPAPMPAVDAQPRALSELLELVSNTLGDPGERHPSNGVIPAGGVNTLGEVMDGPWYVNRHAARRMSREELIRGAGADNPPATDQRWQALTVKLSGLRPGILISDSKQDLYLLRFDSRSHPELATGAEMVASKFFYALGYHVPETYLVSFERRQLIAALGGEDITSAGTTRDLVEDDIDRFLEHVATDRRGRYRAVATLVPMQWKGLLGPYQVYGSRTDDPNDIVPHEHRRDLRGLFVFSAWLNHNFMRALNTLDVVVERDSVAQVRHYLIDFIATLGSGGPSGGKRVWEGNETVYPGVKVLKNIATFGIYTPAWMRENAPNLPGVGHFGYEAFDPEKWTTNHQIAPFANRLPDDEFWAARQVVAFVDDDIRAIVSTGNYSDPEAEAWIARALMERRDRIGRTYLAKVLPLDNFRIEGGRLEFDDLAIQHGFASTRGYEIRWFDFDNELQRLARVAGASGPELPGTIGEGAEGAYYAARIAGEEPDYDVTAYFRKETDGYRLVGVERSWPGKTIADPTEDIDTGLSRYGDLDEKQKRLFQGYADEYDERTDRDLTAQQYFDSLTVSEKTTYDAITHALMNSKLTDAQGGSLGTAFDLVESIERIAGQYYGRSGDQQFRIYVRVRPETRDTLEKAQEFHFGHENTVYHVGYPASYRQEGNVPNIQFSISEDGNRADIDVDYRSSKSPQALFNGHLTSANSDVRSGDNYEKHNRRWGGFVNWWRDVFGRLDDEPRERSTRNLLAAERPEPPTPLPPNRPSGASIEEIQDAVQEFLTDWLVRRDYGEALDFLSPRAYACLNLDDDSEQEALDARRARDELRTLMRYTIEEMGDRDNLTEAIDAVDPWDPTRQVLQHPFDSDFTLVKMAPEDAAQYLCGQRADQPLGSEYYGVLFRFKEEGAAVLGLLWSREQGTWRLVSYRVFEQ